MGFLKSLIYAAVFMSAASCSRSKADVKSMIDKLAGFECRAMLLKEQRFALANQIRFTQDSLVQQTSDAEKTRLQANLDALNKQKDVLVQHSLSLADTIRLQLDSLTQNQSADAKDRASFDKMLNEALEKRGCNKKL